MPSRILHLIDPTTPADAMRMVALLAAAPPPDDAGTVHRVVGMGHRSSVRVAEQAGLGDSGGQMAEDRQKEGVRRRMMGEVGGVLGGGGWVPSVGWADPAGWRGVKKQIAAFKPTHLHAWGIHGIAAAAALGFKRKRLATSVDVPSPGHARLARIADRRGARAANPWTWIATSPSISQALVAQGLPAERVACVRPGVVLEDAKERPERRAEVMTALGIASDGAANPIILLGGEGPAARHDYGLWAAAILQQIFPRTRAIVREDPRGVPDTGIARFVGALPNDGMLVIAPPEMPWGDLLRVATVLLATPGGPMPTGTLLAAMAAGVPVIGTPVACVGELIEHGRTGLLAGAIKPRAIAACLEAFMDDPALGARLAENARAQVAADYSVAAMREAFGGIYGT